MEYVDLEFLFAKFFLKRKEDGENRFRRIYVRTWGYVVGYNLKIT